LSGIPLGPASGRLLIRTARAGLASAVGHDLVIEATGWSGDLRPAGDDLSGTSVDVTVDLDALVVVSGSGGAKPLTERDRAEIGSTMRRLLGSGQAVFRSTRVSPDGTGGGTIDGELSLHGVTGSVTLRVTAAGPDRYDGSGTVVQSAFGITPYSAFLGALRVRDAVTVEFSVTLG
jgi:hypothetical protein